jgi:2,4-dienoyl-CoA reductase-like NADH-dependent reductase (Old Yellow Enzyme family)
MTSARTLVLEYVEGTPLRGPISVEEAQKLALSNRRGAGGGALARHPTGVPGLRELLRRFHDGEFDLVSVGRSLIGDAEWVRKVREGRLSDIRPSPDEI